MATTEAQLCNIALARIGQRQFIDSLAEDTAESKVCAVLYADARDATLERLSWPFARKRQTLALLANTTRSGWEYVYALPADCIAPRYLYPGSRIPGANQRIPYALEHDAVTARQVLLADLDEAELVYTARIEPVSLFPPLFVDALAWKLAADLALAIPVKGALSSTMEARAEQALAQAAAAQWNQEREDLPPDAEHIRER